MDRRGAVRRCDQADPGRGRLRAQRIAGDPAIDGWMRPTLRPFGSGVSRARLVVLISGTGSLLQALLDATSDPGFPALVVGVVADSAAATGLQRAADLGVPTRVVALGDHPRPGGLGRRAARRLGVLRARLVVSAGFMRIVGPKVLPAFPIRFVNTHPALLPSFPARTASVTRWRYGARSPAAPSTSSTTASTPDRSSPRAWSRSVTTPTTTRAALHERIKEVERRLLVDVVGAARPQRLSHRGTKGSYHSDRRQHSHRAPPAAQNGRGHQARHPARARQRLRQDRARGARPRRCTRPASSSSPPVPPPRRSPRPECPSPRSKELTGFPECLDGRVKTLHPRVHAGILADLRLRSPPGAARRAGRRAVPAGRRQPLPVPGDRDLRRHPRRVRRADRHRRSVDGPRRRQEPSRPSPSSPAPRATPT